MGTLIKLSACTSSTNGSHHQNVVPPVIAHYLGRQPDIAPLAVGSLRTRAFLPRCTPHASRRINIRVQAEAASAAQPLVPDETPKLDSGPVAKFKALLSPFSEPSTNKKLLALCGAQALSSVATLIHDTYLPLYLSEELKLSNTKASLPEVSL